MNLGWILYLYGRFDEAISQYEPVLRDREISVAQFNLGLSYLAKGDIERARSTYAEGISEFGAEEGERIGAKADLEKLIRRGVYAEAARRILITYWP